MQALILIPLNPLILKADLKLDATSDLCKNEEVLRAKGFAFCFIALALTSSCSKKDETASRAPNSTKPEVFPIANTEFKNCRFQDANPVYTFGSAITDNPIICDQGVAKSVRLLSPNPLPLGLSFANEKLSLTGTPNEKIAQAPYQFYIENEAGYQILKIKITVQ